MRDTGPRGLATGPEAPRLPACALLQLSLPSLWACSGQLRALHLATGLPPPGQGLERDRRLSLALSGPPFLNAPSCPAAGAAASVPAPGRDPAPPFRRRLCAPPHPGDEILRPGGAKCLKSEAELRHRKPRPGPSVWDRHQASGPSLVPVPVGGARSGEGRRLISIARGRGGAGGRGPELMYAHTSPWLMSRPGTFKMAERGASGGGSSGDSLDKSITLPPDEIFRNLENAKRFAIDIGGRGRVPGAGRRAAGAGAVGPAGRGRRQGRRAGVRAAARAGHHGPRSPRARAQPLGTCSPGPPRVRSRRGGRTTAPGRQRAAGARARHVGPRSSADPPSPTPAGASTVPCLGEPGSSLRALRSVQGCRESGAPLGRRRRCCGPRWTRLAGRTVTLPEGDLSPHSAAWTPCGAPGFRVETGLAAGARRNPRLRLFLGALGCRLSAKQICSAGTPPEPLHSRPWAQDKAPGCCPSALGSA